eukprot:GFUD01039594.1.p1 GENE.GFUD01039594.1~~GFUD01039594.1.p1  ORF type:complete len:150 (+),score=44.90 GFUD01039594.1:69-518(+)
MSDWGKQWNGQQNTDSQQGRTVNGQPSNWGGHNGQSDDTWGGQFNGQQAVSSYNGHNTASANRHNGQVTHGGYSYNGQVLTHQSHNGHGWNNNHMTGHSTSYSGYSYGQTVPPGNMRQPPPYGGQKKEVDWDEQVDQVFKEELGKLVDG